MSRDHREIRVVGTADAAPVVSAGSLDTLEDVLRWGDVVEVIVQDEYTHDVICRRGALASFVVFDTT